MLSRDGVVIWSRVFVEGDGNCFGAKPVFGTVYNTKTHPVTVVFDDGTGK